jgi:hypothetical protein
VTLPLTPETLAAAYDYLVTTPPFRDWGLPESEDVKFKVGRFRTHFAHYQRVGKRHTISASSNSIGQTRTLMEKIAHELIHLHLEELGMDTRGTATTHSGAFRRLAAEVCQVHGFDVKAFY